MRCFRVIFAAGLMFLTASADCEADDLRSAAMVSENAGLQPCLGAPVAACLSAMRPFVNPLEYGAASARLDHFDTPDVGGHRPSHGQIAVTYHSRFAPPHAPGQLVILAFGADRRAESVEISLSPGTEYASTFEDYTQTRIFEAALFALGPQPFCRDMATPMDFFRFFQLRLRPRLVAAKDDRRADLPKLPVQHAADTGWTPFCGRKIRYFVASAQWGWIGADMTRTHKMALAALAFR